MPRVKRGKTKRKRKKKIIKAAKGYRWNRKNKYRAAKQALMKAWTYQYRDRKQKKRDFRKKWQTQINAACRQNKTTYSRFIHNLKENNIELDRKILAEIAQSNPKTFTALVKEVR